MRPTLILDAMGADQGSAEMVRGAADALRAAGTEPFTLALVSAEDGDTNEKYRAELTAAAPSGSEVEFIQAADKLPKEIDSPLDAYKAFPQSSINVAMRRAVGCENCAVISPGTTGLVMTAATLILQRAPGIDRAPIGTPMPTRGKELFYVDGGSNVDCKPHWLYQFAVLAHLYVKNVRGVARPSIALLSNGTEEYKGNAQVKEAYQLLAADKDLNFAGYVEGHSLYDGHLDIMVCDGFLGNILLKAAEGIADSLVGVFREEFKRDLLAGLAAKLLQGRAFRRVRKRLDFEQFGGAPLLGLNGNVVICHGRSGRVAIKNALGVGYRLAVSDIGAQVAQYVRSHEKLLARQRG